jgi:hypothetical protein
MRGWKEEIKNCLKLKRRWLIYIVMIGSSQIPPSLFCWHHPHEKIENSLMISFLNVSQVSGQDVSSDFVVSCRTQTFLKAPQLVVNISCLHNHMSIHSACLKWVVEVSTYAFFYLWSDTTSQNCCHWRTYCSSPGWYMSWRTTVEWYWRENRRTRKKTCTSDTLPTINPTLIEPGANPGLRGERPATNHLSHVTALLPKPYCWKNIEQGILTINLQKTFVENNLLVLNHGLQTQF